MSKDKACLVAGCTNRMSQGQFVGDLCAPCHAYLKSGKIGHTDSFLGSLREASELADQLTRTLKAMVK